MNDLKPQSKTKLLSKIILLLGIVPLLSISACSAQVTADPINNANTTMITNSPLCQDGCRTPIFFGGHPRTGSGKSKK